MSNPKVTPEELSSKVLEVEQQMKFPQTTKEDRRYYYIRVKDITNVNPKLCSNPDQNLNVSEMTLAFMLSDKKSDTRFQVNPMGRIVHSDRLRIKNEAHMFGFESEQVMKVKLFKNSAIEKRKKNANHEQNSKEVVAGYAKILLTPFVVMPHTRHRIKIKLYNMCRNLSIQNQIAAIVDIQLYFLLKFEAKLQLIPIQANLYHNTALFGLMRPCLIMSINNQRKKSLIIPDGGIHPRWQQYAKSLTKGEQIEKHEKHEKQQLDNVFSFDLISAGHDLHLEMINYPFISEDVQLIGEVVIQIETLNFFKYPGGDYEHVGKKAIKIYYEDPETKQKKEAGEIDIISRFVYDQKEVRAKIDSDDSD